MTLGGSRTPRPTLRHHGFAHGAGGDGQQRFLFAFQVGDFLADEGRELLGDGSLFGIVADTAPGEQIRAIADIALVVVAPADKFQVLVGGQKRKARRVEDAPPYPRDASTPT